MMKNLKKIFKIFIIRFGLIFFADSDHSDLKEELDKSRLNFSPIEYKSYSLILSLILGIITPIIVFLIFQHIIIASFFILLIPILYIAAVLYPAMYSSIRKDRIENNLYNSISYMYSLYSTNTTFKKIFTEIAESEAEFEEISIEAKEIIKYIEMGYSAVSAIRKVQKTTPSIEFSEFLDNLIQIQSTGGDVEKYLKNKTEEYKDLEKDKTEKFIQKVEMIGQFYIIGVGLAPILFLMMAVMLHSLKPTPKEFLYIATYVWIPIGTTIVTIILSQNTGQQSSVDLFESDIINYFDFKKKVIHYLKQPLTSFVYSIPISIISFLLLSKYGILGATDLFVISLIIVISPFTILYEKKRYQNKAVLDDIYDFINIIKNSVSSGLSMKQAIGVASESNIAIKEEVKNMYDRINMNETVQEALDNFAIRISGGKKIIKRYIQILKNSSIHKKDISETIEILKENITNKKKNIKKRTNQTFEFKILILMSFGLLLFMSYFSVMFLEELPQDQTLKMSLVKQLLYHMSIVSATCSGPMMTKVANDNLKAGFKYSIILIIISIISFNLLIF